MRIAVFHSSYESSQGGAFTYEDSIIRAAGSAIYKHTFVVFHKNNLSLGFDRLEHYRVSRTSFLMDHVLVPVLSRIGIFVQKENNLTQLLRRKKIDVAWYLSPSGEFDIVGLPYIATVWDLQHRHQPYFPEVSIGKYGSEWDRREKFYRSYLSKASFVIPGTEEGKKEISLYYGITPGRIFVIPMPTPAFALTNHNKKNIQRKFKSDHGLYLFYPASFFPHKNHICAVNALKIIRDRMEIDMNVVFTGCDMGNKKFITGHCEKLGLKDHVKMLGLVDEEKLKSLYRNAFALVFPSFFGPDNFPPLEAYGFECPVIAANADGVQEQLGKNNALFFDPTSEIDLAGCIKRLLDDNNLRNRLIINGKKMAHLNTPSCYLNKVCSLLDQFEKIRRCWN